MEVRMEIARVIISEAAAEQVIVLREKDGDRSFPIVIGIFEAVSIDRSLKGVKDPRPLTHDLAAGIIRELGGTLERVAVNDLRKVGDLPGDVFFAKLHIDRDGEHVEVDSRPSDAIAIAARVGCPIFVEDSVIEQAAG